jgi:outer membrane protein
MTKSVFQIKPKIQRRNKGARSLVPIVLAVFLSSPFVEAQQVLSLNEAIALAKKNNPDLVNARYEKTKANEKVSQVYSESLVPTMTLNSRYTRALKKQAFVIFDQVIEIGSDNTITNSLDVTEPIPILGTPVMQGINIAEHYTNLASENVKQIEAKIKADVTKAYLNALWMKAVIEVNEASLRNAEENLRVVNSRYQAGVNTEFDYLRAKVKVETLKPELTQSRNNFEISKKLLKNTIGLKPEEDVEVVGGLVYDTTEVFGPTENIIRKAVNENVAVRQLKITGQINDELIRVDEAGFYPKLYVFGQYAISSYEDDGKSIGRYHFIHSANIGVGLSWNLNLWANQYKQNQTIIEKKRNEENLRKVRDLLKTQSESVLLRLEDAKNRIVAMADNIALAERGVELANVSFKSGVINQIDVLDAELSLSQVRLGYIQAVYDYLVARTDLEQLLEK